MHSLQFLSSRYLSCSQSPATFACAAAIRFTTTHNKTPQKGVNPPYQDITCETAVRLTLLLVSAGVSGELCRCAAGGGGGRAAGDSGGGGCCCCCCRWRESTPSLHGNMKSGGGAGATDDDDVDDGVTLCTDRRNHQLASQPTTRLYLLLARCPRTVRQEDPTSWHAPSSTLVTGVFIRGDGHNFPYCYCYCYCRRTERRVIAVEILSTAVQLMSYIYVHVVSYMEARRYRCSE